MDWRQYIHSDSEILVGKPTIKGTRLAVDFILDLFSEGWTQEQIIENYPTITKDALQAVFAFASECLRDEAVYTMPSTVAQ